MHRVFLGTNRKFRKEKILMAILALLVAAVACADSPNSAPDVQVNSPIRDTSPENEGQPEEPAEPDISPIEDESEILLEIVEIGDRLPSDQTERGQKYTGVVIWFNDEKGYGFIAPDDGKADILVHYSSILGKGYRTLKEGQKVLYNLFDSNKGPAAIDVVVINGDTSKDNSVNKEETGDRRTGVVNWFNAQKGYGFITPDDGGKELYVHYSFILEEGYRTLEEGQKVEYTLGESNKGPAALDVTVVK